MSITSTVMSAPHVLETGRDVRLYARSHPCPNTSGLAPTYLQANLLILPSKYASDFRLLCARNPVPCPLIAESSAPGKWDSIRSYLPGLDGEAILTDVDMRNDAPKYNVYKDSKLVKFGCSNIMDDWTDDHVAFLIGCSFSFESSLTKAGLPPLHIIMKRNVPMYRTSIPLCPAGVFTGSTFVVSMRPYKASDIPSVRNVTRAFSTTHGEPIAWGWDAVKVLCIEDLDSPQWGDVPITQDGVPLGILSGDDELVPVFWGCGVTPQEAVMRTNLQGVIMAHTPGHMLLLDCKDSEIVA
ncbi:hypothetical protein FHL15_007235 [Xylaria flabelliformis]|uniref:DUF1445 domain-containing protein n=1 Tax=Xylaria flabelliformis TaxID=2512241 RepID=A0A553HVC8_9PEZI|nr:hypothetical protein FHL15_007235 [Xylaria flabelliformis]